MIKVIENEEFNDFNRTLICKCPKCGKQFTRMLNEDDVCPDDEETGVFFDCHCANHFITQCPECKYIFWDDDDCLEDE